MTARFKALNLDSSEESEGENDAPTKEALEEKATALYMEALQYQGTEQWDKAEAIYQQLLESEVLAKVTGRVTFINGRIKPSLEHLKYCCYQNFGHVLVAKQQFEDGLELYKKALELDDTDLNLWYKIGLIGMKLADLNVAISAFEEALEISPRHFPSLDNIITATYAQGGLLNCLVYIARALEYNPKFKKGLALKDRIFRDHPSIKKHYVLFNPYPDYPLDVDAVSDVDPVLAETWFHEVTQLRAVQPRRRVSSPAPSPSYSLPCRPTSWLQLCLLLSATHTQLMEEAPDMDLFRPVNLLSDRQFSDVDMEVGMEVDQNSADEEVDNINSDAGNDGEDVEPMGVRGKRRRSSPTALEQWMSGKRRSTRVRNTTRKEEPTLARTLTTLLPPTLLVHSEDGKKDSEVVRWNEDSMDTMDMYRLFDNKDSGEPQEMELTNGLSEEERVKIIKEENYFATVKELEEVNTFLEENSGSDIVAVVERVVAVLSKKWSLHWPTSLPDLYIQAYKIYLQHHPPRMEVPSLLHTEDEGVACVLYGELLLDQWLRQGKARGKPSPLAGSFMGGQFPSLLLGDLQDLSDRSSDPVFVARNHWMRALLSLYNEHISSAVHQLCIIENNDKLENVDVRLVNVTNHFIINRSTICGMLSTLNRKQMVDELADLYQLDDCEQIVTILSEVLKSSKTSASLFQPSLDREAQYSLLLYTLWRLDRVNECMQWGEMSLHETITQLLAAVAEDNCELRNKCLSEANNTILCILTCVNHKGPQLFDVLDKDKLPRLVQSLSHAICRQIECGQMPECHFDTISPWMLLYEIVSHCEQTSVPRSASSAEERLPSSIRLLFIAHEYLGRRELCILDEGVILYQTLYQLQTLRDQYQPDSEEYGVLSQQLEQIFYCLYGHPIKKNKPRYIQEHNVNGEKLTWARSHQVVDLLRPKELPTYDSNPKCSITADTEVLLRRIIELVPTENNPSRLQEQMVKYIEGEVTEVPVNDKPLPPEMADIYYLLADHHFKNKVWGKALRYYILDVCNNPERVDSWACLALARGSMLETKINSCDALKSESDFLKKAMMSCRCYKTSLDMDSGQPTLWIEYGSFSYMVHSFCSRLLKQEQNLSLEMFDLLETQKESMIQTSLSCFTFANKLWYTEDGQELQDERWLHHYMLGKVMEKRQEPAATVISNYTKSMEFLHLNNALYPSLITYNTPQYYAVEALELYYRVHALILKTLEQSEDKPLDSELRQLFRTTIEKIAAGPFSRRVTRREESESASTVRKPIYIDSEETRMATVKRLMESVLECVEAEVEYEEPPRSVAEKREAEKELSGQPAKRAKREDSETSQKSKEGKKSKAAKRNSTESESESESDSESSSSESQSSSESSDDSDDSTEEEESSDEKKEEKKDVDKEGNWKKEQEWLTTACLEALETCAQRFPEHYKSLYRLAHFYFRSKLRRNVEKARQLLVGPQGLFASRKPYNFFNGVWRIPSNEIDRPGSFASHMSRCVHLLVEVLRHTRDHKMLFDLALRLRDTPESDKKYIRDPEREELSREAFSLSVQALRRRVTEAKEPEDQRAVLLDAFKAYKRCIKLWDQRHAPFTTLLTDSYSQYKKEEGSQVFDAAIKYCTQELAAQKAATAATAATAPASNVASSTSTPQSNFSSPDVSQAPSPVPLQPPLPAQQKPAPVTAPTGRRGRGRPPGSSYQRLPNPSSFKGAQPTSTSPADLAQFYRNMVTLQMMNQSSSSPAANQLINPSLINQAQQMMIGNAARALTQQYNLQTEMWKQMLVQQKAQQQVLKDQAKQNSTSTLQQKKDVSFKANALLAPSKVSIFSSQSILLPGQQPKQTPKPQSSVSMSSSMPGSSGTYQRAAQPQYTQSRIPNSVVKQTPKPSPFQQKMRTDPSVSLQHKLLSAKMAKSQTTLIPVSTTKAQTTVITNTDKTKQSTPNSLSTEALISRGVSITTAKPPEIKIPKDLKIGRNLSISPASVSKEKSSLSPSLSKDLTVTILKPQGDTKRLKTNSAISVSIIDSGKKSQPSPGAEKPSTTPMLRMGGAVSITPAKPAKPQVKSIPKADFSISLANSNENKKKEENKVIILD